MSVVITEPIEVSTKKYTYEWNSDPWRPIPLYAGFNTTPLAAIVTSHAAANATPPAAALPRRQATVTIPLLQNGWQPRMNAERSA